MPSAAEPPTGPAVLDRLDVRAIIRWAAVARSAFAAHRSEIDALNVFPVPDGDTGTNLYLTFDAALDVARTALEGHAVGEPLNLAILSREVSRAMLLSARGNSGVILSQLFQGLSQYVAATGVAELDGPGVAGALRQADTLAWGCVAEPKEGTILSVSRAAATQAANVVAAATQGMPATLFDVAGSALSAAREALALTPTQLPALQRAGVVDAGGAGFVVLLESLMRVVAREGSDLLDDPLGRRTGWVNTLGADRGAALPVATSASTTAYEVMYLLSQSDAGRVSRLRESLGGLGDSLLVVGGEDEWNVHVHVNDAGAAVEAGIEAGRPHRIVITHFGDQIGAAGDLDGQAVVACAAGPGLADLMRAAGATVVASGPAQRASAGQLLDAVRASRAGTVILLPNDADTDLAARAAARAAAEGGITVRVVRSRTAVQGLAALAVFDPQAAPEDNVVSMSQAAAGTRHGGVTVARKAALTSAGPCEPGDVLGIVDGDFALVGSDLYAVAERVVERLLAAGGELLTVVTGQDAPEGLGKAVVAAARSGSRLGLEIVEIEGGQPLYPLLLGVE
ncbi:MAG: DAK2 domain-containing protein [Dermatophilaceae bacterium]